VLVGTNGNGVSGTLNITNGGLLKISTTAWRRRPGRWV
jgi:hypothetical protein